MVDARIAVTGIEHDAGVVGSVDWIADPELEGRGSRKNTPL